MAASYNSQCLPASDWIKPKLPPLDYVFLIWRQQGAAPSQGMQILGSVPPLVPSGSSQPSSPDLMGSLCRVPWVYSREGASHNSHPFLQQLMSPTHQLDTIASNNYFLSQASNAAQISKLMLCVLFQYWGVQGFDTVIYILDKNKKLSLTYNSIQMINSFRNTKVCHRKSAFPQFD